MTWSVYGKLLTISSKSLSYQYDAAGNRIGKTASGTSTWYARDAQGNVLSVYSGATMAPQEQHLYGSSRLGMISGATALSGTAQFLDNLGSGTIYTFTRGKKLFELSNHLGNVLATVSDKKFGTPVTGIPSQVSFYTADVKNAQDYYPGGMLMPGRTFNPQNEVYGFNGKRKDNEIYGEGNLYDFGDRSQDPRSSRWWSVDAKTSKMPGWSPYAYAFNNPILYIDPDGSLPWPIHIRSFIATATTGGGLFRGDGRGPSLSTAKDVTSRVRTSFIVDPAKGIITAPIPVSDPSVFFGVGVPGSSGYLPPVVKTGTPTATITDQKFLPGYASFNFNHSGKDPITPQWATPSLDVHASLSVTEDLKNGILKVNGSFSGDKFPSTEAFIVDQSGKNKLFLDAKKEQGGVKDLYGDNKEPLFKVNMIILLDDKGNFTGVKEGNKTYSVKDWNKKITDKFK